MVMKNGCSQLVDLEEVYYISFHSNVKIVFDHFIFHISFACSRSKVHICLNATFRSVLRAHCFKAYLLE